MKPTLFRLALLLALAGGAGTAAAQTRTPPPEGGTPKDFRLAEPQEFTLPNGMKVSLTQYGFLPKATVSLVIRSGNVDETRDQVWLADLTGELMKEGTTSRSAEDIANESASMGGQLFVGVGVDQTTIGGDVLSEFVPQMVRLAADVARNPRFPASELDRLKADLVRQISIQQSQPQTMTQVEFRKIMYPNHAYGRLFPPDGMVQGYTVDMVRNFYRATYGASRARIYVVGRFDAAAVERAIRDAFGSWERGTPARITAPAPVTGHQISLVDRPNAPQSTISLGIPVINPTNPDYTKLVVTNALLGGYFSSRITSNIREDKGYTYSPFSQLSSRYHDTYWAENADVTTAVTGPALKEIFYEIDRLRREPPTAAELRATQNYLAGTFVLGNSNRGGITGQLSFLDYQGLPRTYLTEYVRRVMETSPTDVQAMARTYLDPSKMLIVITGDKKVIEEQVAPYTQAVP